MRGTVTVGRLDDVPIVLHASLLPVFAFVSWTLAARFFPLLFPSWSPYRYWLVGIVGSILVFASVLVHELGHTFVARRRGLTVARISLFFLGGVAEIDVDGGTPGDEFWMALAGPVVSLGLAGGFSALWHPMSQRHPGLGAIALYLAISNFLLAMFNLLPAYPLDGGRLVRSRLWQLCGSQDRATLWASWLGQFLGGTVLLVGVLWLLSGSLITGFWASIVGLFVVIAARGALPSFLSSSPS